jgi:hypothetical protein
LAKWGEYGKEAGNMIRRAVFALVLIGAAFAGGAAINGPGLAWLQRNFAGGRSIIVDGGGSTRPSAAKTAPKQFPTANSPLLVVNSPPTRPAPKKKIATVAELAQADAPLLPESPSTPASALAPLPEPSSPESELSASASIAQTPQPGPRPVASEPSALPPLDPGPMPKSDPVARLVSVETPSSSTSTSTSQDWAALRKRMKTLGVARYTIEGDTDGRVRFSCVIPVDGLKAVGHHFEAEGDDEQQAAEAALKRIALWKATASSD